MGLLPHLNGLYEPPDVDEAHEKWGASCGPATLGAVLHRPVMELYKAFGRPPRTKTWVNLTGMREALDRLEVRHEPTPLLAPGKSFMLLADAPAAERKLRALPRYGLAMIQIVGPWEAPGRPIAAAYRHTHWIGVSGGSGVRDYDQGALLYDVNAGYKDGPAGGWLPSDAWLAVVQPLLEGGARGATGGVWCRAGIELPDLSGREATLVERQAAIRLLAATMREKRTAGHDVR